MNCIRGTKILQLKIRSYRRLYAGLLIVAIGLGGVIFGSNLRFGSMAQMGPGFLPIVCAWLITALGLVVMAMMVRDDVEVVEAPVPRPVFMIFLSVGLFAVLIEPAGLLITTFIVAFVSSYAGSAKFLETVALSAGAAIAASVVFVIFLGLPLGIWPEGL